jgi:hypothetical protein
MTVPESFPPRMFRPVQAEQSAPEPAASVPVTPAVAGAPVGWRWRRTALLLSVAAQLIMIAALTSADRIPASWAGLLLAVAPAPLAALAAFTPPRVARLAVVVAAGVLVAGIAGEVTHTGLFFVPALAAHAGAAARLWRKR